MKSLGIITSSSTTIIMSSSSTYFKIGNIFLRVLLLGPSTQLIIKLSYLIVLSTNSGGKSFSLLGNSSHDRLRYILSGTTELHSISSTTLMQLEILFTQDVIVTTVFFLIDLLYLSSE